jgi:zinc D-Ala-D-Ala carboxypeptidase
MRRLFTLLLVVLTVTFGRYEDLLAAQGLAPATGPATGLDPAGHSGDTDHLQPALRLELDRAIAAAAAEGVELHVTSGWRSPAEQQRLFDAAVRTYGSPEAASHWVLPPNQSEHVRGAAVDVGPRSGAKWLDRNGARFGLCRPYDNEWWHFELLAPAHGGTCPARVAHAELSADRT